MKKRRKSELNKWEDKADRALQDHWREKKLSCECCGSPAEIVHHYIEKHLSIGLRFEELNLIPLCQRCHTKHHLAGDMDIMDKVILKRGTKWLKKLHDLRLERKEMKKSVEYYKQQFELWKSLTK